MYIKNCQPTLLLGIQFSVDLSNSGSDEGDMFHYGNVIVMFRDGSNSGSVIIPLYKRRIRFKLRDECSFFQEEITAMRTLYDI